MPTLDSLSLRDNIVLQGLSKPEKDSIVWSRDLGYNKLQQLQDFFTKQAGGAVAMQQKRFDTYSLGNTSISAQIAIPSTTVGNLLQVTVTSGANDGNFRENDIVVDNNLVPGRIVNVISDTVFQITIASESISSWNTATHFTQGMYAGVTSNAQLSRGSRGRKPLYATPEGDYNYIQVLRESSMQFFDDSIQSYVQVGGKSWYTTNQMITMERLSRQIENWLWSSQRYAENYGQAGEILQSGGLRWSIMNQGGTYNPISNKITRSDLNDTLNTMARKSAIRGRKLYAFMGQQAMSDIQELTYNNIIYSGTQNTFGGAAVTGWDVMKYANAGVELEYVHWPLLDDPNLLGNVISAVTGKPRWSSSILLMDTSPVPSVGGRTNVPVMQKCYFKGAGEYTTKFLPGMMDMNQAVGNSGVDISSQSGMGLAVSDLDGVGFEMYYTGGNRIIAEKMGLIELTS